jgi:hypothetical protein
MEMPARGETQQQGEHGGEIVQTQVEGQVGQADRQHGGLRRTAERAQRHQPHQHPDQRTQREQGLADEAHVARRHQSGQPDRQPGAGGKQQGVDGQEGRHVRSGL